MWRPAWHAHPRPDQPHSTSECTRPRLRRHCFPRLLKEENKIAPFSLSESDSLKPPERSWVDNALCKESRSPSGLFLPFILSTTSRLQSQTRGQPSHVPLAFCTPRKQSRGTETRGERLRRPPLKAGPMSVILSHLMQNQIIHLPEPRLLGEESPGQRLIQRYNPRRARSHLTRPALLARGLPARLGARSLPFPSQPAATRARLS